MSTIISKPAGVKLLEKEVCPILIPYKTFYITIAYCDQGQVYIEKFKRRNAQEIKEGWNRLAALTDYPLIAFFHSQSEKLFEKNSDNLSPIRLNKELAYMTAGSVLTLDKAEGKKFSDAFVYKDFAFTGMLEKNPNVFFTYAGMWLLERVMPITSTIVFIKSDGEVSMVHEKNGFAFKGMLVFDNVVAKKNLLKK